MNATAFRTFYVCRSQFKRCVMVAPPLRHLSIKSKTPSFGLFIDIDGVIVQGNVVIPGVVETFKKLTTAKGELILPTLFVTNSGNHLTKRKAEQLSKWLGIEVSEDHVVCSYDPLKAFSHFHDKNVLVTGQGRVEEIARSVGFRKFMTVDDFLKVFPMLDAIDVSRRVSRSIPEDVDFSPVEAVVLLGEAVRWETVLQVVTDLLLTNGDPRKVPPDFPDPHIPVIACNMDLQWRFTAEIPRFGHGVFLVCLESVYKKITGKDLRYRVMVGKPSVVTYKYAQKMIVEQARKLGVREKMKNVYMIGDNINTDVFGGNLYNDHLLRGEEDIHYDPSVDAESCVRNCVSVLVKTGVFSEEMFERQMDHVHRDFLKYDRAHRQATHTVDDFSEAIDLIFQLEKFV